MSVGVLIPVYNDLIGLEKTLRSLARCEDDFTILIVDDGSSVKVQLEEVCNSDVIVINLDRNCGIEAALNVGIDYLLNIGVDFIARLDSGDEVRSDRFLVQKNAFMDNPYLDIVGSFIDVVNEKGDFLYQQKYPLKHKDICAGLRFQNQLCHPAVMFRSHVFKSGIRYPSNRPAAEDYALFFKLSESFRIANIPLSLVRYVVSDNSISSRKRFRQCVSRLKVQLDYFDFMDVNSYLGVFRTLILMYFPRNFSLILKRLGFK